MKLDVTTAPAFEWAFLWVFEMIKQIYKRFLLWALKPVVDEVSVREKNIKSQINGLRSQVAAVDMKTSSLQADLNDTEQAIAGLLSDKS